MYQSRCVAPGANLLAQLPPLHPAQLIFLLVLSGTEQLQLQKLQLGSRLVGFSAQYQQTLLRLSPIAIAQNRAERFRALAEEMDWSWTTSLTYWRAILTLMTLLNMPLTVDDRGLSRLLAKEAALAPTWSHEDPTQILSTMAIKALTEAMASTSTGDPLRAAYVAMMLGQRVSDVLRLKRENVFIQHFAKHTDTQQSAHTVVLKFVETKTSLKCGHFTLAIPYGTHVATLLIEDRSCSTEEYLYISNRVANWHRGKAVCSKMDPEIERRRLGSVQANH